MRYGDKITETLTMFPSCDDGAHLSASTGKSDPATASPRRLCPVFYARPAQRRKRASLLRSGTRAQPLSVVLCPSVRHAPTRVGSKTHGWPVKLEHFHTWATRPSPKCVGSGSESVRGSGATRQGAARQLNSRRETRGLPFSPPSASPSARGALPSFLFVVVVVVFSLPLSDRSRLATDAQRITDEQTISSLTAAWP